MDLKQYKAKIRDQLLNGIKTVAKKEKAISEGDYVTSVKKGGRMAAPHYKIPKDDYDELIRQMSVFRGPKISMPGHVTHESGGSVDNRDHSVGDHEVQSDDPTDVGGSFVGKNVVRRTMKRCGTQSKLREAQDNVEEEVHGGKFHFVKSMKHLGHDLGDSMKKAGISAVTKEIANQGVKFAKDNIGKAVSGMQTAAQAAAPELLPLAEEAPLLMLAAGMKKAKRTRRVSVKESNRHALIRKLMQQHDCTLGEASKFIKEKNLPY